MEFLINNTKISYNAEGERGFGDNVVLLKQASDLTTATTWSTKGYTIEKLFDDVNEFKSFHREVTELLLSCWRNAGLQIPNDFTLDQYHQLVSKHQQHLDAINATKLLTIDKFPLGIDRIEKRISAICGNPLRALNPYDNQSVFHFRVIRPKSTDNNPLHRDVWLEDYESCINLYIPVAGSNDLSSLIILPGSHVWPESKIERTVEGAQVNGVRFNVPAVTSILGEYEIARPNPKLNELLVFSPYLIHGGSVNLNTDVTRISIELRLWKI
jgi:hypothetical protein